MRRETNIQCSYNVANWPIGTFWEWNDYSSSELSIFIDLFVSVFLYIHSTDEFLLLFYFFFFLRMVWFEIELCTVFMSHFHLVDGCLCVCVCILMLPIIVVFPIPEPSENDRCAIVGNRKNKRARIKCVFSCLCMWYLANFFLLLSFSSLLRWIHNKFLMAKPSHILRTHIRASSLTLCTFQYRSVQRVTSKIETSKTNSNKYATNLKEWTRKKNRT